MSLARDAILLTAMGLFLAALGPFGSTSAPPLVRFLYWPGVIRGGAGISLPGDAVRRRAGRAGKGARLPDARVLVGGRRRHRGRALAARPRRTAPGRRADGACQPDLRRQAEGRRLVLITPGSRSTPTRGAAARSA